MAVYLAVDPATSTGWAAFRATVDESVYTLDTWGHFSVDTSSSYQGDWCLAVEKSFDNVLDRFVDSGIAHTFLEDYFFAKRCCNGAPINFKFRAVIELCLRRRGIAYTMVAPASWFAFVVGRVKARTATTERKKLAREAVRDKYGLGARIPEKEGRRLVPYDVFDACGVGIYGLLQQHPDKSITPNPPTP